MTHRNPEPLLKNPCPTLDDVCQAMGAPTSEDCEDLTAADFGATGRAADLLNQLAADEGLTVGELLHQSTFDSVAPCICTRPGCGYTTQCEPDGRGWCEECERASCLPATMILGLV